MLTKRCGIVMVGALLVALVTGCGGGGGGSNLGSLGLPYYTPPENLMAANDREEWDAQMATAGVAGALSINIPDAEDLANLVGLLPLPVLNAMAHFTGPAAVVPQNVAAPVWLVAQIQQLAAAGPALNLAQRGSNTWTDPEGRSWSFSVSGSYPANAFALTLTGTGPNTNITIALQVQFSETAFSGQFTCNGTLGDDFPMGLLQNDEGDLPGRFMMNIALGASGTMSETATNFNFNVRADLRLQNQVGNVWHTASANGVILNGQGRLGDTAGSLQGNFEITRSEPVEALGSAQGLPGIDGLMWANSRGTVNVAYAHDEDEGWMLDSVVDLNSSSTFSDRYTATFTMRNNTVGGQLRNAAGAVVASFTGDMWGGGAVNWVAAGRETSDIYFGFFL